MAITGKPIETYITEYQSVFTVDKGSAAAVAKQAESLTRKITAQDARYTSIVSKLKEMVGTEGAKGYTDEMERANQAVAKVDARLQKINAKLDSGDKRGLNKSVEALNKEYENSIVALTKLDAKQRQILQVEAERVRIAQAENRRSTAAEDAKRTAQLRDLKADILDRDRQIKREAAELERIEKRRIANMQRGTTVPMSKEMEKELTIQNKILGIEKQISLENNQQIRDAKIQLALAQKQTRDQIQNAAGGGPGNDRMGFGTGGNTTFAHKIGTTAQYSGAAALIFAVTGAMREGVKAIVEYDTAYRTLSAVIENLTLPQARELEDRLIGLGTAYGGSLESINQAAILLGRAGIAQENLVKATEVTIKLAKLTGDTLEVSSGAMISYLEVYGKAGETVESLGDKLAYMANESRLSTLDIETFSNYALAAASAAGLTVDAVSALATQFSKAGVNASTIGTQIRSLTKVFLDNSTGVKRFFRELGIVQSNFQAELAAGGERSNRALLNLSKELAGLTREEFNRITASMDILQRNSLALLRQQSEGIAKSIDVLVSGEHEGIKAADKILESHVTTWERFKVTMSSVAIAVDNTFEASKRYAQVLKVVNAALNNGFEGAAGQITAELALSELEEKRAAFKENELAITKATTSEQLAAGIARAKQLNDEITLLTKQYNIFVGMAKAQQDPNEITEDTAKERIKNLIALKAIEEKRLKTAIELNKEGEKSGVWQERIDKSTEKIKVLTNSIALLKKNIEQTRTAAKADDLVPLEITFADIQNLTKGYNELLKAGNLAEARLVRPMTQLNDQLKVQTQLINNIAGKDIYSGFIESIQNINLRPTDLTSGLLTSAKLNKEITNEISKQSGMSQEDLAVSIRRVNFLRELSEIEKDVIKLLTEKQAIENNELTQLDKQLNKRRTQQQTILATIATREKALLNQNDVVALAERETKLAYDKWQVSKALEQTEVSIAQTLQDKKAYEEAVTREKRIQEQLAEKQATNYKKQSIDLTKQVEALTFTSGRYKQINDIEAKRIAVAESLRLEQQNFNLNNEQTIALLRQQSDLYEQQINQLSTINTVTVQTMDLVSDGMNEYLSNLAQGEKGWVAIRDQMIGALSDMLVKLLVIEPIVQSIKSAMSGTTASSSWLTSLLSIAGGAAASSYSTNTAIAPVDVSYQPNAKGGAYYNGVQAFASGGIVSSPTLFPMAGKKTGLMGEAGPEAIVPLTRVSGGDLGIKATQPIVNISVINNTDSKVTTTQDDNGNIQFIIDSVTNSIASGISRGTSPVGDAIQSTYGVRR